MNVNLRNRTRLLSDCALSCLGAFLVTTNFAYAEIQAKSALVRLIETVDVPAQAAGPIVGLEVQEGTQVTQGDMIAQIDDAEVKLALRKAQIEYEMARQLAANDVKVRFVRKKLEVAEKELVRANEAIQKYNKSISQTELDKLRLAVDEAKLAIEQSEHEQKIQLNEAELKKNEIAGAETALDRRRVRAPLSGVVDQIAHKRGEWVEPGEKLVRILRLDRLRVEAFVPARDAKENLLGTAARFTVEGPNGTADHIGQVVFVSPEVDPVNQQVRIWVEVDNRGMLLRPGDRGTLTVLTKDPAEEDNK